jgi:hypothetical protein
MGEEVDVAYFKILFQNLFGRTEENHETQLGKLYPRLMYELGTS